MRIDVAERRARLVARHRLDAEHRARTPDEVARSLVALHSTDSASVFLSIRARSDGVEPEVIERAFYEERSLLRLLAMRRTLWVVERRLAPTVHAAATIAVAARERRRLEGMVRDSGISTRPRAWITRAGNAALAVLAERGEATTSDLSAAVPMLARKLRVGAGTRWEAEQSAAARVLPQLAMEGRVVRARPRGAWTGQQYGWAPLETWLGEPLARVDPETARADLVRTWLRAFGPAMEADLRWWTGWSLRDVRAALAIVPHVAVDLEGAPGIVLDDDVETTAPTPPAAALLPTLDPTTMGWKERGWYLGELGPTLFDRNGNAGATVWWDGRAVGGWAQRGDGEIAVGALADVGADAMAAIETEAERLQAWLGDVRVAPVFAPPFQRSLAA